MKIEQFTTDDPAYLDSIHLRDQFLRRPLGLELSENDTVDDCNQLHFGAFDGSQLIASVSIKPIDRSVAQLRQMVVHPDRQGTGVGSELVVRVEKIVKSLGYEEIIMDARLAAASFYRKLGYTSQGEPYSHLSIEHIKMSKRLR